MRSRLNILSVLEVTTCFTLVCPAVETSDPTDPNRYLNAVRTFTDNALKYGRNTYWGQETAYYALWKEKS